MGHNNQESHAEGHQSHPGYGTFTMVWIALLALTALTVAVAGIDLGKYIVFVALLIASVKAMLVINIFMHIKFEDAVFKAILGVCGFILAIIFSFLATDVLTQVK